MKLFRLSPYVAERIQRSRKDWRRDTFRSGGKGGQHQNKTETGVRLTCLKTGISAESREHRSQAQNHNEAFHRVVTALIEHYSAEERREKEQRFRASSTRVRTYDEKRNVAQCEKSGVTHDYQRTLDGELEPFIRARLGND